MYIKLYFTLKIIIYFNAPRRARHQGKEHAAGASDIHFIKIANWEINLLLLHLTIR